MEFDQEREPNGLEDEEQVGPDEEDDDDDYDEPPINILICCELMDAKQPCTNIGKCVVIDPATGTFDVCKHFIFTDAEGPDTEWEET